MTKKSAQHHDDWLMVLGLLVGIIGTGLMLATPVLVVKFCIWLWRIL